MLELLHAVGTEFSKTPVHEPLGNKRGVDPHSLNGCSWTRLHTPSGMWNSHLASLNLESQTYASH